MFTSLCAWVVLLLLEVLRKNVFQYQFVLLHFLEFGVVLLHRLRITSKGAYFASK